MSELEGSGLPFEEFQFAQSGAMAHLVTMAQAARDAAEDVLAASPPPTGEARLHAQRLNSIADACDALRVLVELADLPPDV
jgi:hypothetical protein